MKKIFIIIIIVCVVIVVLLLAGPAKKTYFKAEKGNPPYTPAIQAGNILYISGQISVDPKTGKFIAGTMEEEAELTIKNIERLCKKAGMELSDVVRTSAFITNMDEFPAFNKVFRKYFPENPPARATVQVVGLSFGAKIEISAIAVK